MSDSSIGILGAGSFGTALGVVLARAGDSVLLWGRRPELVEELVETRANERYLPGAVLPDSLQPTNDLEHLATLDIVLMAVPSQGYRSVLRRLLELREKGRPLAVVSAVKGLELEGAFRMSEVTRQEAVRASGSEVRFAALSGPNFAVELADGSPSLAVLASEDAALAEQLQESLSTSSYRLYSSTDVVGVELGGASKNVVAIAAGVLTGLGFGHNTMAALITRGLHEITRLGVASGGLQATFSGLAGLGDLVLTCTGGLSRNRATGEALAGGQSLDEIVASTSMVAEGVKAAPSIARLAAELEVEMPITERMVQVMYGNQSPRSALEELMTRDLKREAAH